MFKKILSFVVFILVISTAYLLIHTLNFKSKQINFTPAKKIEISDSAIHHLSRAIKIKTISPLDPIDFDSVQFVHFSKFLSSAYPFVENNLLKTTINQYSYLYRWQGFKRATQTCNPGGSL